MNHVAMGYINLGRNKNSKTPINAFQVADAVIRQMNLKNVRRRYAGGSQGLVGNIPIVHLENLKTQERWMVT
jgi:hypothetical protein